VIAWLALRDGVHYRRAAFAAGLQRAGYRVEHRLPDLLPGPRDVLVIWNRYGDSARAAAAFEARGLQVLVAENGYLGNEFAGRRWYAIARNQHNGAGTWNDRGPERWDGLRVSFGTWRGDAGESVLLPQRGIGPSGVAMPRSWESESRRRLLERGCRTRTRPHPGTSPAVDLEQDLSRASLVVTWGSGAALKALLWGIPVAYSMPNWIGAWAALPLRSLLLESAPPVRDDDRRLAMFRRLAWAQWTLEEIQAGEPFAELLKS
jgi:hypothetical protein